MPGLLPHVDPDGLLEYSVVYTDRALNHMARRFQGVMTDIAAMLKQAYGADAAVIVPGSGTFAMEAVARQFVPGGRVLVIRNGWFSFRWSQIIETGKLSDQITVLKARRTADAPESPFAPAPIDEVVAAIRRERPAVVFAPHVETSAGMMLPDDYLRAVSLAPRLQHGDVVAQSARLDDLRPAEAEPAVAHDQHWLALHELARDSFHRETAAARHDHRGSRAVGFAQHRREVAHDALEALRHMVQRAIRVDDRVFKKTVGIDIGQQGRHLFSPVMAVCGSAATRRRLQKFSLARATSRCLRVLPVQAHAAGLHWSIRLSFPTRR